ncbi:hypothetical protein AGLY_017657 [Aphis glycines]|uniref:HAT C-terminal dimerisation domain-containing protein n=1 Tax=Aphis glycines TaxID=307491 RepID=A0A6G0SU85_APHGL|nr:hypothetical protein AGLY_017657 [Aphis glycines]
MAIERKNILELRGNPRDQAIDETMRTWQTRWNNSQKGRWTHSLIGDLRAWVNKKHGSINFHLTQALSGHGCFAEYLHRFGKLNSPECWYCSYPNDDAMQTIFNCDAWYSIRNETEVTLGIRLSPENMITCMLSSKMNWTRIDNMIHTILSNNSNDWDNEAIVLSQGFINLLDSRQTYFLLIVFSKIFSLTNILYEVLQTKRLDILYCVKKIEETKCQLQNYRLNLFEKLWETVLSDKGDFELQHKIRDPKTFYKATPLHKYSNYTNEFPNSALENLQKSNFGEIFDFIRLRNELIVLYKSEGFLNTNSYDLVKKIKMNDLISAFQEVFKLGQLILTISSTTAPVERSFSELKQIKSYQRSTQGQERLSSLSLISIEKELLHKEKNYLEFYDKVITEFLKQ